MKNKELISVVIITYKNTEGMYCTLDSVLAQTYPKIEIIISDDGTPGFLDEQKNIYKYIEEHGKGNVKKAIVSGFNENQGTAKNLNHALRLTTGKYIKAIASEDKLSGENALEKYYEFLSNTDSLICFAKMRGVQPDGSFKYELSSCESNYELLKGYTAEQTCNRLYARNFLPAPAWFAKRELFENFGFFHEKARLIEDYPYWCYLARKGVRFSYLDEVLIDYKLSGVSSGGSYSESFMNDMLIVYDEYIFPYDQRFGKFQGVYNRIKKAGLNYYMTKAKWDKLTLNKKILAYIKYGIFYLYTGIGTLDNKWKNLKTSGK